MTVGTSIFVLAVGAILAFAVQGDLGWLNVQAAGWVLIATGVTMMVIVVMNRRRRRETLKRERVIDPNNRQQLTETRVYRDVEDLR